MKILEYLSAIIIDALIIHLLLANLGLDPIWWVSMLLGIPIGIKHLYRID